MNDDSQTFETADGTTVRADTLDSAHTVALLKALPTDDRENPGLHLPGRHFDIQRLRRALLEFEHEFDTDTAHLSFHSPKTSTAADHVLVLQPDESSQLGIGLAHKPPARRGHQRQRRYRAVVRPGPPRRPRHSGLAG